MIVIIGVLAAFGVPKFLASVEKSKATEAFNFWSAVQSAEERYIAQNGVYAFNSTALTAGGSTATARHHSSHPAVLFPQRLTANAGSPGVPTWAGSLHACQVRRATGRTPFPGLEMGSTLAPNSTIPESISPVTGDAGASS